MDYDKLEEFKTRLAERYTAAELIEILDINVWEIINIFIEEILDNKDLQEEVGIAVYR